MSTTKAEQVKELIDLSQVDAFVSAARAAATFVEETAKSSKTDDEKRVAMFDKFVELGLCDESELPVVTA